MAAAAVSGASVWEAFRRTAEAHPHSVAVRYGAEWFTFREVRALAARFGKALSARYGVGRRDLVALSLRNTPEWLVAMLGVSAIGAVTVPIEGWDLDELRSLLASHAITAAVCDNERLFRYVSILNGPEPTTLGGVILCRSFVTSVIPFVDHWRSMTAPNWGDNQETSDEDLVGSILEEPTTNDGSMAPPAESAL